MRRRWWGLVLLGLVWAMPVRAGAPVRCITYEEKTLNRWQTICNDGMRATSYRNRTLERRELTIQPAPGIRRSCSTRMHSQMNHVEVRCQ
jgi:hypothetical protein